MNKISWGIIGCGDVVERKSGKAFQTIPGSQLVAVMRRDVKKAADYAKRNQVPKWYGEADALIQDPDINAIYIATPPAYHEGYAVAALEAGKDVYLEKPMALESQGAARILASAEKSKGKLVIAHYRRALPAFRKVKELLEEQKIGQPLYTRLSILQPLKSNLIADTDSNWRINPALSGGGYFHDLAPHQLDLMLHFFGEVKSAAGFSSRLAAPYEANDLVSGGMEFKEGLHFQGLWCFSVPPEEATDYCEIIGSKGKISFSFFGKKVKLARENKNETFTFQNPDWIQQPMIEEVVAFFSGIGPNPCPAAEAVEGMHIMDAFTGKA